MWISWYIVASIFPQVALFFCSGVLLFSCGEFFLLSVAETSFSYRDFKSHTSIAIFHMTMSNSHVVIFPSHISITISHSVMPFSQKVILKLNPLLSCLESLLLIVNG